MDKPEAPRFSLKRLLVTTLIAGLVWIVIFGDITALGNLPRYLMVSSRSRSYSSSLSAGDIKKARAMFEGDIKANPADPEVYKSIAAACVEAKQNDLAREYLERSLLPCRDAPREERSMLYFLLCGFYEQSETTKPKQQAILAAQRAMELDPLSPKKLNAYGYLLADNDLRLDEALLRTGQALQLLKKEPQLAADEPDLPAQVEDSYGWALYKLGRYEEAVSALNQAISDYPRKEAAQPKTPIAEALSTMYFHIGAANRRLGHLDAAGDDLQTALRYSAGNKEAQDELADMKSTPPEPAKSPPASAKPGTARAPSSSGARSNSGQGGPVGKPVLPPKVLSK